MRQFMLIAMAGIMLVGVPVQRGHAQQCGAWQLIADDGPSPRNWGDMVYRSVSETMILFGGSATNHTNSGLGDTWEWSGSAWELIASTGPERRFGHAMVYDSARDRVVLFGGRAPSGRQGDTWEFDGTEWTLAATTGPPSRFDPAMAYDSVRQRTVMFGGSRQINGGGLGDTWEWDGIEWTLVATEGPPARVRHAMAFDPVRGRTVLFAGSHGPEINTSNDTWEWDGVVWEEVVGAAPTPRRSHMMAFLPDSGRVLMFGGFENNGGRFADAWEFDGQDWIFRSAGPDRISQAFMATNTTTGNVLMFGGHNDTVTTGRLFEIEGDASSPTIWQQPDAITVELGTTATFSVIGGGGLGTEFRWRHNGLLLEDDGRIFGSRTPTLTLNTTVLADRGTYDVVILNACGVTASAGAALMFVCYVDCDQSTGVGVLDIFDFLCFQNSFVLGESYACDCDISTGIGVCDIFDFICFQGAWVAGCP